MNKERIIREMAKFDGRSPCNFCATYVLNGVQPCRCGNYVENYLEDHNAVQRVIERLAGDIFEHYVFMLAGVVDTWHGPEWGASELDPMFKATPLQKCKAVLEAKGLWDDY